MACHWAPPTACTHACRVDKKLGLLLELPLEAGSAGGYVHVSNTSDERSSESLDKRFKPGEVGGAADASGAGAAALACMPVVHALVRALGTCCRPMMLQTLFQTATCCSCCTARSYLVLYAHKWH